MEPRNTQQATQFKLSSEVCTAGPFKGYERLDWINSAAKKDDVGKFSNLMHHLNKHNLRQAFHKLDGSTACGIDRVTKHEYTNHLQQNLEQLDSKIQAGGWYPKPSRQVFIPKPQGGKRPLAVGCLEDKIVQNLVAKILEAIYEPTFDRHSFGFRRGKSTHQALAHLYKEIQYTNDQCYVVEVDFEKFFDSINHEKLMDVIEQRISDPHFLRLIRRLLRNSILDPNGKPVVNLMGTPQGSPVSPILANIYLHATLDTWFRQKWDDVAEMIRYADDAVFVFHTLKDAKEFLTKLKRHLKRFGIVLNKDKTKIIPFSKEKPKGVIYFVGFVLYWGYTRFHTLTLKVKTAPQRLAKCIQAFKEWIKAIRNRLPLKKIWALAAAKLRGHFNYYGVSFNQAKLNHFYYSSVTELFKWLNRRSQKRSFDWEQFTRKLMYNPLPKPLLGAALIDITNGLGTQLKRKLKSRMRKLRTYGSVRSFGWQQPLFT